MPRTLVAGVGSQGPGDSESSPFPLSPSPPPLSAQLHYGIRPLATAGRIAVKIIVSEEQIRQSIERLAGEIRQRESGRQLTVIAVMTGSIVFLADLIRKLDLPLRVGLIQARSYAGTERGSLSINAEMLPDIAGRDVLLIDDIFDTGHTLLEVISLLDEFRPKSIRSAVLVLKRGKQKVQMRPDYIGFEIPDVFVVGYGLDYNDAYRNLPYLAALEPEDIAAHSS
ncbi:MAG: hypoxanthine phosphoribosyltransferase [Pirellulaceae bacterium]|nr:hypoxanthine phosphoribosyltransferase [Pirellulaceae bacterium]